MRPRLWPSLTIPSTGSRPPYGHETSLEGGASPTRLEVGAVNINDVFSNLFAVGLPHSGWKSSGLGARLGGAQGLRKYCRVQAVTEPRIPLTTKESHLVPVLRPAYGDRRPSAAPSRWSQPAAATRPLKGKGTMTTTNKRQVVAITGGARGIGYHTAEELIRRGHRVAIGDIDELQAQGLRRGASASTSRCARTSPTLAPSRRSSTRQRRHWGRSTSSSTMRASCRPGTCTRRPTRSPAARWR
ncbi:aldehyde dehydrogenase family protein [Nocardioides convexus]|uniref:aldehyde dehydrogenase family protein n=1 Tax=Nocardioides convexus TaxID=2712224 RepID=UPI00241834B8|nr:aldehyde dehydrogenase family protein [Nocardioides convexus]